MLSQKSRHCYVSTSCSNTCTLLQITIWSSTWTDNEWEQYYIVYYRFQSVKSDWICFQIIMKCLWIVQANQWKSIFRCHSFDQEKLNCIFSITAHAVVILFGYMVGWPWSESINHVFGGQKLSLSLSLSSCCWH